MLVYLKLLIRITSLLHVPRARRSWRPSRDQSKKNMSSDLKSVSCLEGPPLNGWLQTFTTPSRRERYVTALPSGLQRIRGGISTETSNTLIGSPPSIGTMAILALIGLSI